MRITVNQALFVIVSNFWHNCMCIVAPMSTDQEMVIYMYMYGAFCDLNNYVHL